MDFQESFVSYLYYEKRCSSHTVTAYKNDLDQFAQYCAEMVGEFNVKTVDSRLIRNWVVSLMESGQSSATVNRKITTLKSFFNYLMRLKLVESNLAKAVPLPKTKKVLPNFVEEKNLNQLLDNGFFSNDFSGVRDKIIFNLFYGTGIRLSELIGLKDSDFDTINCTVKVLGKRNKERIVPYPQPVNSIINEYKDIRNATLGFNPDCFLVTSDGKPVYAKLVYRVVKSNLTKVTLLEKKSPHVLRHSFATHLMNNGADLNAVKELLGHANLAATQIYTHVTFKKIHDIYKQAHPRG